MWVSVSGREGVSRGAGGFLSSLSVCNYGSVGRYPCLSSSVYYVGNKY